MSALTDFLNSGNISSVPGNAGSGSESTFVATGMLRQVLQDVNSSIPISVKWFGAKGDGVTDDTAAFDAAIIALKALGGGEIIVPKGNYLWLNPKTYDSTYSGIRIRGFGKDVSKITKGFSGDLITLNATTGFEIHGIHFVGQYGTYTGRCIVMTGASPYPRFTNNFFEGFSDSHIYFGPDAGQDAQVTDCRFFITLGSGQPINQRFVQCAGPDTTAMKRIFQNCHGNGFFELTGALDTTIVGCMVTSVSIDNACSNTLISGTLWANTGVAMSIGGGNTCIVNCRFSGNITLISGSNGSFIGNLNSSGTFTNSAAAANWTVFHHPLGSAYHVLGDKALLPVNASGAHCIVTASVLSAGDTDQTYTPASSAETFRYANALTTNRTVTLSTTNAIAGNRLRVCRPGGDTGGPWTVSVGGLKSLSTLQWCDVEYNGSSWILTAFGSM